MKVPAASLTTHKAAWLLVFSRGRKNSMGGALDLFRGNYCMFSGAGDAEMAGWVQQGALYEGEFSVALNAAEARANFEAANPDFVKAAYNAAQFAERNG